MKKVLILGAGMVSKPIVRYLLERGFIVTLADMYLNKAEAIIAGHINGKVLQWKVDDSEMLDRMINEHDLIVSLLPYEYHLTIAKNCIKRKKNMITASYMTPEMKALDKESKEAGIIILNEMGLDPGIDHMSAKRIIDKIHSEGGMVEEFDSICGALPAPESANNPFKYKFSWSPKGVIKACNNDAKFLKNSKVVSITSEDLFKHTFSVDFPGVGKLEVYPNRNSLPYSEIYGIPEVKTIYRGTFRFHGWCRTLNAMKTLGFLSDDKPDVKNKTYAQLTAMKIGINEITDIRQKVADHLKIRYNAYSLKAMEWLGLFDNIQIKDIKGSLYNDSVVFDIVSDLMISKMMMTENDRDMVVMQHNFVVINKHGEKEVIRSRMLDFGSLDTDTAISRTVALPAAIVSEMILNNELNLKGVHIPVLPEIYNPVLEKLEKLNIKMVEEYGLP